jgi:beta-glucosidase
MVACQALWSCGVTVETGDPRVDELLARMTLAEKVGQLVQVDASRTPELEARVRAGGVGSIFAITNPQAIERFQRVAATESRLGIPLIVGNDVIHGYRTVFPIPLAEACSWDPPLVEQAAAAAAAEARANGTDWIFAPMVDVCREPRWGRIAEGAGEDPYLGSVMASARVRGFQSVSGVAACPKHYVAYGAVEAGRDYNSVDISERALRDFYLPPFTAAFEAGAETVMSSFNDIAGVPATVNRFTLRTILRDEWDWPGVVVSDYEAINELIQHGVAADLEDAARLSLLAGVDMDMMSEAYHRHLAALVDAGAVPLELVDQAVKRVLRLKLRLGLFERQPIDLEAAPRALLGEEARALALRVAHESLVLLKNDSSVLPLSRSARVAVVGSLAEARRDMLGCWAAIGSADDVETILDGLAAQLSAGPAYVPSDPSAAVEAANASDVTIAVVGETADLSGEAHCRAHLGLPGPQQELVDALARTGKPLVVVLAAGRPLVIPRLVDQAAALLLVWHPGIRAGRAIADVLFGEVNPSGRLAITFPRAEGQIPIYYGHKNTGRPPEGQGTLQFDTPFRSTYLDEPNSPLFPFGFGLGYTSFGYSDPTIESPVAGRVVACATLTNTGTRAGTEVVQLYVRDLVASVTRPVRELKAFERVSLEPGESRTVRFEVPVERLGFTGLDMRYRVEPGEFRLWIGPDSASGLEGAFRLDHA